MRCFCCGKEADCGGFCSDECQKQWDKEKEQLKIIGKINDVKGMEKLESLAIEEKILRVLLDESKEMDSERVFAKLRSPSKRTRRLTQYVMECGNELGLLNK